MKEKIVFFDIDNTLVHHRTDKSYIPSSTLETIKQLKLEGHRLAFATGRGYFQMKYVMDMLGIKDAVCFNGHQNLINHQVVHDIHLDEVDLKRLVKRQKHRIYPFLLLDSKAVYIKDFFGKVRRSLEKNINALEGSNVEQPFGELKTFNGINGKYHSMMLFEKKFNKGENYPNLSFNRWGDLGFDVGRQGVSKLTGVQWMAESLGYAQDDIVVFGDGYNDVEMLEGIKNSVAMGNGVKEAKDVASFVTGDVDKDGIKTACHQLGLI